MGEPMAKDGGKEQKLARLVILWDANGIKVQSNGVTNPTVIAMLEMAKATVMAQTVGPSKQIGADWGQIQQAPTLQPRQIDREVS